MRSTHFLDSELETELKRMPKSKGDAIERLVEHRFIANCLKIGLTMQDLQELEYKDVAKIMICYLEDNNPKKERMATQQDIDKLFK